MKSFAQVVLNAADQLKGKNRSARDSFNSDLIALTAQHNKGKSISESTLGMIDRLTKDNIILAELLLKSMRFTMDSDFSNALEKLEKNTQFDDLIPMYQYMKLPYPVVWFELTTQDKNRLGWIIEGKDDHLRISRAVIGAQAPDKPIYLHEIAYNVTEKGVDLSNPELASRMNKLTDPEGITKTALCILLLMNSRSNIVKIVKPTDSHEKLNKQRSKKGKYPLVSNSTVTFDVARIVGKDPSLSPEDAKREMAASLVRGHFKVRKTGVFFWSPYVRGAKTQEDKDLVRAEKLGQQRSVTMTSSNVGLPRPKI